MAVDAHPPHVADEVLFSKRRNHDAAAAIR
jgi:hypothetical protein